MPQGWAGGQAQAHPQALGDGGRRSALAQRSRESSDFTAVRRRIAADPAKPLKSAANFMAFGPDTASRGTVQTPQHHYYGYMHAPPPLSAETHIAAVALKVSDLERSLHFYQHYLGLQLLESDGVVASLGVKGSRPLLVLHEVGGAQPRPPRSTGLYHFAILHPSRLHLARTLRHLIEMGYPLQGAADHLVSEAIYLADPDDIGIEVYADRPRSAWPRSGDTIRMSTDPLDFEGLMAELNADGAPWLGLPAGTTMGHVHLHVDDLRRAEAFYCGLLGFDLIMRYGPSALFVSAGGYHHHIGLNTWAGLGAPPPPADAAGLHYYEIVVPGQEAWAEVVQRIRVSATPVRQVDGGVELRDPAGNGVRLVGR